jgi:denticleless
MDALQEKQRTTLQPHDNGIFDLKWNHDDTLLATASGDLTAQISCPTTQRALYTLSGHASTVKCVSWDPNHHNLLSTGGRDGSIHIWDLRVQSGKEYAGVPYLSPVLSIRGAHDEEAKGKGRKKKSTTPSNKTVTSLAYAEGQPYNLISSGSNDG